ncbi:MAG: porin family protein [Muribaculaceae bacterium]|nr:porin family protein [Muribaculaceae bacterium]
MKAFTRTGLQAVIFFVMVLLSATGANAQVERGQKSFGPKVGFVSNNTSATAGLTFNYAFSRHVRISPELGVIFRHKNRDGLTADLNVQFPLGFGKGKGAFYPLVGANFTSWGRHYTSPEDSKDVTSHTNTLGLNAGAGLEMNCTSSLRLSLEARYTLMKHYPTAFVTAGITYVF